MARSYAHKQPKTVQVTAPSPFTLASAMKLANGDRSRLRFNPDGSITVVNTPRPAPDPYNPQPGLRRIL